MQQSNKPYRGLFVTIEGGDGCGKSTLCNHLVAELEKRGYGVLKTREPGGTPLSEKIRGLLLDPKGEIAPQAELLLYLAARAQNVASTIKPALLEGKIVICERFHDSTIAYQGAARHLGRHYVESLCHFVAEDPDFTLFLDLDPEEGMKRMKGERKQDRLEKEKIPFHQEVRQGYLHQADAYPQRITVIDASQSIEQVVQASLKALQPFLK
jgi:dTMP kinase